MIAGRLVSADPEVWKIIDGKLFFGYSKTSSDKWSKNADENIKRADQQWLKGGKSPLNLFQKRSVGGPVRPG